MAWQVLYGIFTALCTGVCLWALKRARDHANECAVEERRLAKAAIQIEMLAEEQLVLKRRLEKLSGRFFREERTKREEARDRGDGGELDPADVDPELGALLALQTATPSKP